jgi:periplasmic divalent cation tolerance protein
LYNTFVPAQPGKQGRRLIPSLRHPADRHQGDRMTDEYVIVLTTLPPDADGPAFARGIVEAGLAACVNLLPLMESIYRWEGSTEQETERQVVIKTARERVPALWERVRELHPYDVPEFLVLPIVDGNDAYLRWVAECTSTAPGPDEAA